MDYTQIISAVIALISALVSAFLIPWLKTKIDTDKLQTIRTYVEIGVKAAEQLYTATDGAAKKAYVVNFLAEKGIQFDVETIDKLIEAAVLQLHHDCTGVSGYELRYESVRACKKAHRRCKELQNRVYVGMLRLSGHGWDHH